MVGVCGGGGTPGPFSNPVVKPTRADGTEGAALWETRSMPTLCLRSLFFSLISPPGKPILPLLCSDKYSIRQFFDSYLEIFKMRELMVSFVQFS